MSAPKEHILALLMEISEHFPRKQEEMAKKLGIGRPYLNQLLKGNRVENVSPTLQEAIKLVHKETCSPSEQKEGKTDVAPEFVEVSRYGATVRIPTHSIGVPAAVALARDFFSGEKLAAEAASAALDRGQSHPTP